MLKRIFALATIICSLNQPATAADNSATLTEAKGNVFKRGFIDWDRQLWSEPQPAQKGDLLQEGMQIGTGDKSWAQLTWPYLTARAWANSVYAIAPNHRLVYLLSGEMLYQLDKNRKDKRDYCVWTKLIQARVHGTTVLFQSTPTSTRVTVLEGCVDVMNRTDRSVIRVTPGVVYEVKDKTASSMEPVSSAADSSAAVDPAPITAAGVKPSTIFDTQKTETILHLADANSLLNHPLVNSFTEPLRSLSLVQQSLTKVSTQLERAISGNLTALTDSLAADAKIVAVPHSLNYRIGPVVGNALTLPPAALTSLPPTGVINAPSLPGQLLDATGTARHLGIQSFTAPITPAALPTSTTALPSAGAVLNSGTSSLVGGAGTGAGSLAGAGTLTNIVQTGTNSIQAGGSQGSAGGGTGSLTGGLGQQLGIPGITGIPGISGSSGLPLGH